MPHMHKVFTIIGAIALLSGSLYANSVGERVLVDQIEGVVNGTIVTKKQLEVPQIANNGKPFTFEQYAAHLLWQERAEKKSIVVDEDVTRSVIRYKEDNGLAGLPDDQADMLLKGQIGIDFDTYRAQLTQYFMIESFKSYEFRNRCSVAELEVRSYYDTYPVINPAEYRLELVSLTPEQFIEWEAGTLLVNTLEWDSFDWLPDTKIAPHISMVRTMPVGGYVSVLDSRDEPILVHLLERKDAHLQTIAERYHTIELALQREKIAAHAAESEKQIQSMAVVTRLS